MKDHATSSDQVIWRKSSRSGEQGECVEIGKTSTDARVRDTKLGQGSPVLQVSWSDLASLTRSVSR
ncbi:DUF397 domain-containing protein [Glycomyces amatae]|uniref:DUF397 domain-containing protein n=1 Tax=Glycomyces amatae TaxID=2881355 RepID=UPI0034E2FAAF